VTSVRDDDGRGDTVPEPAWHERTPTLVGATVAALLALAILYFLISTLVRHFGAPEPAPAYYVDPGDTSSHSRSATSTTTSDSITSTVPPSTSDFNPGDTTSTTPTTTDTSPNTELPTTHRSTSSSTETPGFSRRPRFNETRTLYPRPN
jgi:cytoskeletal protein RodZ